MTANACDNQAAKREDSLMPQREEILEQAMSLPPEDRAFLAIALEDSLPTQAANTAFLAELQRRSAAYRNGTISSRPAVEVLADLRQRQATRATA